MPRLVMPDTCTFEAYGTRGCKLQYTGADSLLGLTDGIRLEFRMKRCAQTPEGLPAAQLACVGALCEAFARPTPCAESSDCSGGLACVDFAPIFGDLDLVGEIVWRAVSGCDSISHDDVTYSIPEDQACSSATAGQNDLRNILLFLSGTPTDTSSDLKFCMLDLETAFTNIETWAEGAFVLNDAGTELTVTHLERLAPSRSPPFSFTLGTGRRRALADEIFDADQFARDVADALRIDPARIEVTAVEWVSDTEVKVTIEIEVDSALSDAEAEAELAAAEERLSTMAQEGTLPAGDGTSYTVNQVEVDGVTLEWSSGTDCLLAGRVVAAAALVVALALQA